MPRKGSVPKREVLPDPVYGSVVVSKLINNIMLDGKKGVAQSIVYDAFDMIRNTTGEEPLEVFEKAMNNIMPVVEVKARRVGGANYQVPIEVRADRRQTLGLRWLTLFILQNIYSYYLNTISTASAAFWVPSCNIFCSSSGTFPIT